MVKYLNNRLELDHGKLKQRIRPVRGCQSRKMAHNAIRGFETMRMSADRKPSTFPRKLGCLVDDAEVAENSRRIGEDWGAQTSLAPAPEPVLDAAKAKPEREPARKSVKVAAERVPMASLRIEVPDYLDRDLAMEAVKQRCTKQYLVMKALRKAGYKIDDAHMMEDGRKAKRKA